MEKELTPDKIFYDKDFFNYVKMKYNNNLPDFKNKSIKRQTIKYYIIKSFLYNNIKNIIISNNDAKQLIINFILSYLEDFFKEVESKFNWTYKNVILFYDLMKDKYKLSRDKTTVLIFYFIEIINFLRFIDIMNIKKYSNINELMERIVKFDLSKDYKNNIPEFFILKYLLNLNNEDLIKQVLNNNFFYNIFKIFNSKSFLHYYIKQLYLKTKKNIEQKIFENELSNKNNSIAIDRKIKLITKKEFFEESKKHNLDIDKNNYIIEGRDFSRESPLDKKYKDQFMLILFEMFNTRCAKCGKYTTDLQVDHFWLPKYEGGNFIMKHKNGSYVNNGIPLCRSCNPAKGNKSFLEFFEKHEIEQIIEKSQKMNEHLNILVKINK